MVTHREMREGLLILTSVVSKFSRAAGSGRETGTRAGYSDWEANNFSAICFGGKYIRLSTGHKKRWDKKLSARHYPPWPRGQVHPREITRIVPAVTLNPIKSTQQPGALVSIQVPSHVERQALRLFCECSGQTPFPCAGDDSGLHPPLCCVSLSHWTPSFGGGIVMSSSGPFPTKPVRTQAAGPQPQKVLGGKVLGGN